MARLADIRSILDTVGEWRENLEAGYGLDDEPVGQLLQDLHVLVDADRLDDLELHLTMRAIAAVRPVVDWYDAQHCDTPRLHLVS